MDALQEIAWVDSARLGIGGWSYGGILTNYTIAQDTRFKAAISGAGSLNQLSMYGSDMYITQYQAGDRSAVEGAGRVDQNFVSVLPRRSDQDADAVFSGAERFQRATRRPRQMYQALRSLGIDTQLVIYPNQFHGITIPSYRIDRMQRYLNWYAKYLSKTGETMTMDKGPS